MFEIAVTVWMCK